MKKLTYFLSSIIRCPGLDSYLFDPYKSIRIIQGQQMHTLLPLCARQWVLKAYYLYGAHGEILSVTTSRCRCCRPLRFGVYVNCVYFFMYNATGLHCLKMYDVTCSPFLIVGRTCNCKPSLKPILFLKVQNWKIKVQNYETKKNVKN